MTSCDGARSALADPVDRILEISVAGSFSRIGYEIRSRLLPEFARAPEPPLDGRTVLITGATSGIGLSAAIRLASHGASVHFLARSKQRAERTRRQIAVVAGRAGYDPDGVSYGIADLDSLASVRDFASAFAAGHDRLDVLIHNAGAIHPGYQRNDAGLELTVAGQVVAPFLLTYQLFGLLRQSAPSRVITVSSGGMYTQGLDLSTLQMTAADYNGVTAYARAKRAQVALSAQWAKRAARSGVAFHATHPGWVRTPGIAQSLPTFSRLAGPVLRTPDQGADTIVWLASADPAALSTGRFWHDRRLRPVYRIPGARPDPLDAGQRLWDWTAEQAGVDASRLPMAETSR
jgi:NAD(P)-dependent dehydrogenase (short-subunit alcohol dehydrogenase family)